MRPRVILVTDPAFSDDKIVQTIEAVAPALRAGWLCVQLRDKQRALVSLRVFGSRLRVVTQAAGAALVVNGDARLARDIGADGVHLGRGAGTVAEARGIAGEDAWVSVACHSNEAVRRGVEDRADGVLVSPVFDSRPPSPADAEKEGRGLGALRAARVIAGDRCAVYALGGVGPENALACVDAGADGIAVIRSLLGSAEPGRAAAAIHDALGSRW
jgi:thiamine-phosphate diphosphorylase